MIYNKFLIKGFRSHLSGYNHPPDLQNLELCTWKTLDTQIQIGLKRLIGGLIST